jgi:16S rRNA (guanine1207-N2)-methyltransferase
LTLWRSDPDRAAADLITASFGDFDVPVGARLLLIDQTTDLPEQLASQGFKTSVWNRRITASRPASAEPPAGPFDVALLRLPKSKSELEMSAHLACARLVVGGRLIIYGGNDEGVRHVAKRLVALSNEIATLSTRAHGRVIAFTRPVDAAIKGRLSDWRIALASSVDGGHDMAPWITYPGLFANGALDDGTALLIAQLPKLAPGAAVLDYGCGTGRIAHAVHRSAPDATIDAIDHDTIACVATRENVRGVNAFCAVDLAPVQGRHYDLVVSNPPIHNGIREDHAVLQRFVTHARDHLKPRAPLIIVVQRRIAIEAHLLATYKNVKTLAETGTFRVWCAA